MKKIIGIIIVLLLIVGVVAASHKNSSSKSTSNATGSSNNTSSSQAPATSNAVATDKVKISNFLFSPASITVKKGTKVTWTNADGVAHTVTADTMPGPDSKNMAAGAVYSYTFDKAGTYAYHCDIHSDMKATVVVTE